MENLTIEQLAALVAIAAQNDENLLQAIVALDTKVASPIDEAALTVIIANLLQTPPLSLLIGGGVVNVDVGGTSFVLQKVINHILKLFKPISVEVATDGTVNAVYQGDAPAAFAVAETPDFLNDGVTPATLHTYTDPANGRSFGIKTVTTTAVGTFINVTLRKPVGLTHTPLVHKDLII